MKNNLRYEIYSDGTQSMIDYRPSKKEAITRAYELVKKYGEMTVVRSSTGEIVFQTAR